MGKKTTNGEINIHDTHPNMYWMLMAIAVVGILLAANFLFLHPTFPIWGVPNAIWAVLFLVSSVARIVTLTIHRRLRWIRYTMAFSMWFMFVIAIGTVQPFLENIHINLQLAFPIWDTQLALPVWDSKASLQLPIVYVGLVAIQWYLMKEPFLNPETEKKS